jgi:L-alanine-DL-glutamate epimerase-like enolase superfamily enzyme
MKITGITCKMIHVPYKGHYQTSAGRTKFIRRVLVFIDAEGGKDNGGITGVGETGAILPERGGETVEGIYIAITKYFAPLIIGMDAFDIGPIIDKIESAQMGRTGFLCSKCGIDNALYDIMGQATNRPVAQLLGGIQKTNFRVSRSLGIKPPAELAKDAIALKEAGYALITIKIGFDPKEDIDRVAAVRDAVGPRFPLEVDVNSGYNVEVAIPTLRKMRAYDIEAIEQPGPWWDIQGMKEVRRAVNIPIIADESAWTPHDVINLAREGACDVICIKPFKNGGLYLSRRMAEAAEAAGLGVSMGSKHPLSTGLAAILHFAAGTKAVRDPLGYGSPLERLADDICETPIEMNGDMTVDLPTGPGLGVRVSDEKIAKYRVPDIVIPDTDIS